MRIEIRVEQCANCGTKVKRKTKGSLSGWQDLHDTNGLTCYGTSSPHHVARRNPIDDYHESM